LLEKVIKDFLGKYSIAICPAFEVSSTEIRKKVKNGESISDLVPKEVENYILEKELYRV
jgi:nicotinate-nucleotide adenylyltransferase